MIPRDKSRDKSEPFKTICHIETGRNPKINNISFGNEEEFPKFDENVKKAKIENISNKAQFTKITNYNQKKLDTSQPLSARKTDKTDKITKALKDKNSIIKKTNSSKKIIN